MGHRISRECFAWTLLLFGGFAFDFAGSKLLKKSPDITYMLPIIASSEHSIKQPTEIANQDPHKKMQLKKILNPECNLEMQIIIDLPNYKLQLDE
jgi:hypothetical protein